MSACSAIFINVRIGAVRGKQKAFVALHDTPFESTIGKDGNVVLLFLAIDFGKRLGDIGTVIEDDAVVGVALKGPLVGIAIEFVFRGRGVANVALGRVDEVGTFAKGEVVPMGIVETWRNVKRERPGGTDDDHILLSFGQCDGRHHGISCIGLALYATGHFRDNLALHAYVGQFLKHTACSVNDAVDDGYLPVEEVLHLCQRFRGVEVAFLCDSGLIAGIVRRVGIGADARLCTCCAVEDVAVHRQIIGVISRRACVVDLDGLQEIVGADDVAPVILEGIGVAVHERMVADAVEVELAFVTDEGELSLRGTDVRLHGACHLAVLHTHAAASGLHTVLLVILRLEGVPLGQRILHFDAVSLDKLQEAFCPDLGKPLRAVHIGMQVEVAGVAALASEQGEVILKVLPNASVAGKDLFVLPDDSVEVRIVAVQAVEALLQVHRAVVGAGAVPDRIVEDYLTVGHLSDELLNDGSDVVCVGVRRYGSTFRGGAGAVVCA